MLSMRGFSNWRACRPTFVKHFANDSGRMTGYLEVIPGTKPFSVAGQKSACGKHYQISNDKRASGKSPGIRKKKGNENLFPKFTTWREQIDGQYWFPTYTRAEDTLWSQAPRYELTT